MGYQIWTILSALTLLLSGCTESNDTSNGPTRDASFSDDAAVSDAGSSDDAATDGAVRCEVPTTHQELINAETDAQFLEPTFVLPLLKADGTLPDLPQ